MELCYIINFGTAWLNNLATIFTLTTFFLAKVRLIFFRYVLVVTEKSEPRSSYPCVDKYINVPVASRYLELLNDEFALQPATGTPVLSPSFLDFFNNRLFSCYNSHTSPGQPIAHPRAKLLLSYLLARYSLHQSPDLL